MELDSAKNASNAVKSEAQVAVFDPQINVGHLNDEKLLVSFEHLVKSERKITHHILKCIAEIDKRRLYLKFAFSSLFDFLNKKYGYSPAAAMRRIDGARLLREIPELAEKIETGKVNLTQAASIQAASRTSYKENLIRVDTETKKELLHKIENSNQSETQSLLAKELDLSHSSFEKHRVHRDQSVTLNLNFSKDDITLMEKAKDLNTHSVPSGKWTDYFTYVSQKELKHLNGRSNASGGGKALSVNERKRIISESQGCAFVDPVMGKRCGSFYQLQVDHIQPRWAGGGDEVANLQVLCGAHNRYKYQKEAQIRVESN